MLVPHEDQQGQCETGAWWSQEPPASAPRQPADAGGCRFQCMLTTGFGTRTAPHSVPSGKSHSRLGFTVETLPRRCQPGVPFTELGRYLIEGADHLDSGRMVSPL